MVYRFNDKGTTTSLSTNGAPLTLFTSGMQRSTILLRDFHAAGVK